MIKFEEQDGLIFRMLDEPVLLTPDAEIPCLVRRIRDDSPMGVYNKRHFGFSTRNGIMSIACQFRDDKVYSVQGCLGYYENHEIIGTPVAEGSKEWALYQMMQGEKVCNPTLAAEKATRLGSYEVERFNTFWYIVGDAVVEGKSNYGTLSVSSWIAASSSTGWQIYKEPELKYKAGDFVESINWYSGTKHLGQIDSIDHEIHIGTHRFDTSGKSVMERVPQLSITRKLSPSEVVIHIGCLSGTVKDLSYVEDGRFWFIGRKTERCPGGMHCILYLEMFDTPNRELVESLLKAQEEEK